MWINRGCHPNDSLAGGYLHPDAGLHRRRAGRGCGGWRGLRRTRPPAPRASSFRGRTVSGWIKCVAIANGCSTRAQDGALKTHLWMARASSDSSSGSRVILLQHHDRKASVFAADSQRKRKEGQAVMLLHPPLPSVGVSIRMERGCQQNDSLSALSPSPAELVHQLLVGRSQRRRRVDRPAGPWVHRPAQRRGWNRRLRVAKPR